MKFLSIREFRHQYTSTSEFISSSCFLLILGFDFDSLERLQIEHLPWEAIAQAKIGALPNFAITTVPGGRELDFIPFKSPWALWTHSQQYSYVWFPLCSSRFPSLLMQVFFWMTKISQKLKSEKVQKHYNQRPVGGNQKQDYRQRIDTSGVQHKKATSAPPEIREFVTQHSCFNLTS